MLQELDGVGYDWEKAKKVAKNGCRDGGYWWMPYASPPPRGVCLKELNGDDSA